MFVKIPVCNKSPSGISTLTRRFALAWELSNLNYNTLIYIIIQFYSFHNLSKSAIEDVNNERQSDSEYEIFFCIYNYVVVLLSNQGYD